MKTLTFLFLLFSLSSFCQFNVDWGVGFGHAEDEEVLMTKIDQQGNVINVGIYRDSTDLDPSSNTDMFYAAQNFEMFVQKLDPNGDYLWGASFHCYLSEFKLDDLGNIYITGIFDTTTDFDPGPAVYNLSSLGSYYDGYVVKLSPNGDLIWASVIGGNGKDYCTGLAIDDNYNVYLSGSFVFYGLPQFHVFQVNGVNIQMTFYDNTTRFDAFVVKLDSNGQFVWNESFGGDGPQQAEFIDLDANGDLIVAGSYYDTFDIDPGPAVFDLPGSPVYQNTYVQKLDTNGNFISCFPMVGCRWYGGQHLPAFLDDEGNFYTVGQTNGNIDYDPGPGVVSPTSVLWDIFIQKYDSQGNFMWFRHFLGDQVNEYEKFPTSILVDDDKNVFVSGIYRGNIDLNTAQPGGEYNSNGGSNSFVIKFDELGDYQWGKSYENGGTAVNSLTFGPTGNLYVSGGFSGTTDLDFGASFFNLTSHGGTDGFVAKLGDFLALDEHSVQNEWNVYPNPVNDVFHISQQLGNDLNLTIVDIAGKVVLKEQIYEVTDEINISGIPSGIYFVRLENNGLSVSKKIVKN